MLRNRAEPTAIRRAALRALKAAAFLGHIFDPHRADYTQCLRDVATEPEADSQLREEALEVLAIQNDDFAQGLLLRGLEDPKSALVRTAKAIQFLAYDDHGKAAPVVRKILDRITDVSAKAEALRLLASDPQSQGLFANLLKDKAQPEIIRTLSASGLKLLNPQAFAQTVRELITDKDEREELRATLLSALTQLRERNETDEDPNFVKEVEDLAKDGADALKSSARRFIQRFGR
jgi:hypothetical protein